MCWFDEKDPKHQTGSGSTDTCRCLRTTTDYQQYIVDNQQCTAQTVLMGRSLYVVCMMHREGIELKTCLCPLKWDFNVSAYVSIFVGFKITSQIIQFRCNKCSIIYIYTGILNLLDFFSSWRPEMSRHLRGCFCRRVQVAVRFGTL